MKVLVAPLNWGLGHAARCIPVITELLYQNIDVVLCAEDHAKSILSSIFPQLSFVEIPGIKVTYPANGNMSFSMLRQSASFFKAIAAERNILAKVAHQNKITHVISDSRFGLSAPGLKCVIISHQLKIRGGILSPLLFKINHHFLSKFTEVWIPDNDTEPKLSGALSDTNGLGIPSRFIGILSRFSKNANHGEKKYEYIALLSGPEPQRTLLENKIDTLLKKSNHEYLVIRGLPGSSKAEDDHHINSISPGHLAGILHPDTVLISRPGYSTIMDMAALGHRKLLFIPTPGQTEQEYLSRYMSQRFGCISVKQKSLDHLPQVPASRFFIPVMNPGLLQAAINGFLSTN